MSQEFYDPIKDEPIYLTEKDGSWFWGNEELMPLSEANRAISKTDANCSFTANGKTFLCHFNPEKKRFAVTETVTDYSHTVWTKNKQVIFNEEGIAAIINRDGSGSVDYFDGEKFEAARNEALDEISAVSKIKSSITPARQDPDEQTKPLANDSISSQQSPALAPGADNKPERKGYFAGLKDELVKASENEHSIGLGFVSEVRSAFKNGMKKNKFLTIGATVGAAALTMTPLGPVGLVIGGYFVASAGLEAAAKTIFYSAGYAKDKLKGSLSSDKDDATALDKLRDKVGDPVSQLSKSVEHTVKSLDQVKSSIKNMRSAAFDKPVVGNAMNNAMKYKP